MGPDTLNYKKSVHFKETDKGEKYVFPLKKHKNYNNEWNLNMSYE